MVMDLLGPDMEHLLEFLNKRTFSSKTGEESPPPSTRPSYHALAIPRFMMPHALAFKASPSNSFHLTPSIEGEIAISIEGVEGFPSEKLSPHAPVFTAG